mmetsp:Transcript_9897/g.34096  ORF Transcript_9897/g.34096 Transcript_9897/m.34096 type:complete len:249 (-) Transcript_9897:184-930(-)
MVQKTSYYTRLPPAHAAGIFERHSPQRFPPAGVSSPAVGPKTPALKSAGHVAAKSGDPHIVFVSVSTSSFICCRLASNSGRIATGSRFFVRAVIFSLVCFVMFLSWVVWSAIVCTAVPILTREMYPTMTTASRIPTATSARPACTTMTKACCFCLGFIASRSCLKMSLSLDMLMVRTKSSAGFTSPSPTICPSSSSSSSLCESKQRRKKKESRAQGCQKEREETERESGVFIARIRPARLPWTTRGRS